MSKSLEKLVSSSPWFAGNAAFIESIYEKYLENPNEVPENWKLHFDSFPSDDETEISHKEVQANFRRLALEKDHSKNSSNESISSGAAAKQAAVLRLINAFRVRGHQNAKLNPLNFHPVTPLDELAIEYHGLTSIDLGTYFNTGSLFSAAVLKLADIQNLLKTVYTGSVGSEYMHITDTDEKRWIQQRLETYKVTPVLNNTDKEWLLKLLTAAEGLEKYLHTRYVGQKRFSLEGGESLIPLLDELIQRAGNQGAEEVVIGMAHRGRLNVLTNILGKPPKDIFEEFEGTHKHYGIMTSGDVKYHKGFSSNVETPGGITHITLGFNPSHLEIISPVIEGSVRARQQRKKDTEGNKVLPILIHGDAAFAGQGVVMETFNISQARGFYTGGSVHIVINNQIGFTTSDPLDSRSTHYCTDVAKMIQAPIFHVNGDDPEAVIFVTRLALDYRNRFHKDVVIDLVCYRRHGHNEADEPAVTQPMMYQAIRVHDSVRAIYADKLLAEGITDPDQVRHLVDSYRNEMDIGNIVSRPVLCKLEDQSHLKWQKFDAAIWSDDYDAQIEVTKLKQLATQLLRTPDNWPLHPRIERIMEGREKMAHGDQLADWGFAETLAYASLVDSGYPVRLSGQDVRRGTFFHRHAMVRNQETGESYVSLQHLSKDQANFIVIDSVLSEEAVLAYEYGYATAEPNGLTLWEAQFGDFANGAQVVIDQFIASAGSKWGLHCGLTLLLPHGYEGQGPEHSSARIERYMQLCAEHNIQVCIPSTPAQIFHLLRRQIIRTYRRPLVVITPKSLLRHPLATSSLNELSDGHYLNIIDDIDNPKQALIKRVIFCSGKIYYDLLEAKRARNIDEVAIVRIEQLYPFPHSDFNEVVSRYKQAKEFIWCQEEPQNQGAWDGIKHRFHKLYDTGKQIYFVGRHGAAAPATGFPHKHKAEQEKIINDALTGNYEPSMNRSMNQGSSHEY